MEQLVSNYSECINSTLASKDYWGICNNISHSFIESTTDYTTPTHLSFSSDSATPTHLSFSSDSTTPTHPSFSSDSTTPTHPPFSSEKSGFVMNNKKVTQFKALSIGFSIMFFFIFIVVL